MIELPERCLRGCEDCKPLSQIEDEDEHFICVGLNDPCTRDVIGDIFRVCWVNEVFDEKSDWDERDILDTVSVMVGALSAFHNMTNPTFFSSELDPPSSITERD